jgi:hypothetical protein
VIVIGQRKSDEEYYNSLNTLTAYSGMTGAQYNAYKDMQFAMSSPEERCAALGMDANASCGVDEGSATGDVSEEFFLQLIGGPADRETAPGARTAGRGTELDDYTRARNGLPPRTRWDNVNKPEDLRSVGTYRPGTGQEIRQFQGDGVDAVDFTRNIGTKAGVPESAWGNRAFWRPFGNGGMRFEPSSNFSVDLMPSSATKSGLGSVQINWSGTFTKFRILE